MADLSNKLNEILSDPQMLEQIKSLSSMLGMGGDGSEKKEPPSPNHQNPDGPVISDDTMQMIIKFMPLLTSVNKEDENTDFLRALRPLLGDDRRKKIDEAIKILHMMKFLPLLKNQGIF